VIEINNKLCKIGVHTKLRTKHFGSTFVDNGKFNKKEILWSSWEFILFLLVCLSWWFGIQQRVSYLTDLVVLLTLVLSLYGLFYTTLFSPLSLLVLVIGYVHDFYLLWFDFFFIWFLSLILSLLCLFIYILTLLLNCFYLLILLFYWSSPYWFLCLIDSLSLSLSLSLLFCSINPFPISYVWLILSIGWFSPYLFFYLIIFYLLIIMFGLFSPYWFFYLIDYLYLFFCWLLLSIYLSISINLSFYL